MIFLLIAAWVAIGIAGFVCWYTKDFDFTTSELPVCIICGGALGPLSWVVGYLIHGEGVGRSRTIVKKR